MDISIEKKAQSFRLPIALLDRLKELARQQNRSLNNYVETLLLDAAYHKPNPETQAAISQARSAATASSLDMSSIEAMEKSMGL